MNISLDTNAALALLLPGREKVRSVVSDLLKMNTCNIADMVFAEVEYVLVHQYDFTRDVIARSIRALMNIDSIICNKVLLSKVLPLYETKKSLSFVDCCLVVYAKLNAATPLYTSDKKLVNQSGGLAKLIAN